MGIEIFRRADFVMAQLLRYSDHVCTVGNQNRGHSVPEGVRVDVGEIMPSFKPSEDSSDTGRVNGLPVLSGEYIPGIMP